MTASAALLDALLALIDERIATLRPVPPVPPPPVPTPPPPAPPPTTRRPRILLETQGARLRSALIIGAPEATRWRDICARWLAGADLWGFEAWNGALLGALTGDARYGAKAVAVIDAQVTAAETAIAAGNAPEVAGDSYLQVGSMIGDLALVYDWCFAQLTTAQRSRWLLYANQAVWNVWHYEIATWGGKLLPWSGWSVDNPCNNYFYSFLRATMLLGLATKDENPSAAAWLTMFRDTKMGQLALVFARDLIGGGSREGTGYGVAMGSLFELYALWQWSTGEDLASATPHARACLSTMIHQITPTLDRFAPTGDQSRDSTATLFDYHRGYLLKLMALYPAAPESARAAALLAASSLPQMASGFMTGIDAIYTPPVSPVPIDLPLVRYASGIGQIYARTAWTKTATWLNLIAGPYTEAHAHHDQGSLLLFKGSWIVTDAVLWSFSGVTQEGELVGTTAAHSLVRISDSAGRPIGQRSGSTSKVLALHVGLGYVFAAVDLTPAYATTAVSLIRRQVLWLQPDVVIVHDRVVSSAATVQTWQLVVPTQPVIAGDSATIQAGDHTLKVTRVTPTVGTWTPFDFRSNHDFSGGWRLDLAQPVGDRTYLMVLSIDGASSPATPTVVFSDVGVSFVLGGRPIALGAGIDTL